jgi:hypothetical protein
LSVLDLRSELFSLLFEFGDRLLELLHLGDDLGTIRRCQSERGVRELSDMGN